MMQGPVAIILAAGHGKRMKSEKAKVLHEVCGRPMIRYVVEAAAGRGGEDDRRRRRLRGRPGPRRPRRTSPTSCSPPRTRQLGTGDAVKACRAAARGLRRARPWSWSATSRCSGPSRWPTCSTASSRGRPPACSARPIVPDPTGFGRILRDSAGRFLRIVEERDCTPEETAIREVNPSCYVFDLPGLWDALDRLDTGNAQGEYYLTDAPALLQAMGRKVVALPVLEPDDILGVNTRQHLAQAHAIMQARIQDHWMTEGVSIVDPRNTYIDGRAEIGRDTVDLPVHGDHRDASRSARTAGSARSPTSATAPSWTTASRSARSSRSTARTSKPGATAAAPGLPGRRPGRRRTPTSARRRSRPTSTAAPRAQTDDRRRRHDRRGVGPGRPRRRSARGPTVGAGRGRHEAARRRRRAQTVVGVPARPAHAEARRATEAHELSRVG